MKKRQIAKQQNQVGGKLSRRSFLKMSAAVGAAGALSGLLQGCADDRSAGSDDRTGTLHAGSGDLMKHDPSAVRLDLTAFPLGVKSGEATPNSVLLCTYSPSATTRRLQVWEDNPLFNKRLLRVDADVTSDGDGFFKVVVEQLTPGAFYYYAFFVADTTGAGNLLSRSDIGLVRTAIDVDSEEPVTVSATTCTNLSRGAFTSVEMMAAEEVDLNLHLGDMSYNDGASSLSDFRSKWRDTLSTEAYRKWFANASLLMSWDDHEIDNNWNPETESAGKVSAGKQAFYEVLPILRNAEDRLWRSFRWGKTAEFFVLDCRAERKPSTRTSGSPIYMSTEQMTWLKDALVDSPCHFKVLLNSVPMTDMANLWDAGADDRWEGYAAQRRELLNHIGSRNITNVWFMSGDFHVGFVAKVEPNGTGLVGRTWEVAVGPGQNWNPLSLVASPPNSPQYYFFYPQGQFIYGNGDNSATFLTFDPAKNSVRVRFIDATTATVKFDQELTQ